MVCAGGVRAGERPLQSTRQPSSPSPERASELEIHLQAGPTCPLCLEALTALPQLEVCPACRSIHHQACVQELRRCGTPACAGLSGPPRPGAESRALASLAWACNLLGATIVGPLVIYLIARQQGNAYVRYQARQSLLAGLLVVLLALPTLGLAVLALLGVSILSAVRAYRGEWTRLPLVGRRPPPEALEEPPPADGPPRGGLKGSDPGA